MSVRAVEGHERRSLSDWLTHNVSLADVRLTKLSAELLSAAPALPLEVSASLVSPQLERPSQLAVYFLGYEFSAQDRKRQPVWRASFTLNISFRLKIDDKEVDDKALKAFGSLGVVEIAHPYARELIHHITARMSVPPFILEVLPPIRK